eukprot:TRINITY_DN6020_c0_g1_i2.p1 TRINITY_DN6020_c0_g1~~TRINITY_DN6020_c0_g1_i2.p1  ORF type:complete len:333 (-),score=58.05 TRINITY_DN6020_c0_g1_i2:71-1069(-)
MARVVFSISGILCHSWSPDNQEVAVCFHHKKSFSIYHRIHPDHLQRLYHIKAHQNPISSLEWSRKRDSIITISVDSTAILWNFSRTLNTWTPQPINIRTSCASLVLWSPLENKIGSCGHKVMSVLPMEEDFFWTKCIRNGISSQVNCFSWHPDNLLVGIGCMDKRVCIYSTTIPQDKRYIKANGSKHPPLPFGQLLFSYSSSSGVSAMSWSPSGQYLAWFTMDSVAYLMDWGSQVIWKIRSPYLPFRDCLWMSEGECVAVGYDREPIVFWLVEGQWRVKGSLDDRRNCREYEELEGELPTFHQNCITSIQQINARTLSTSGEDGRLVIWNLK